MKRFSHFIVLAIKRRIPLRKRKESTLAKLTVRKLRLDPLESRDLLSCVGLANTADTVVQGESFERSNVEYRSNPVVDASRDVDVIYFDLGEEPFCGPLPKEVHEAYMSWMQMDCGLSAAESDAIIAMHYPDNTNDPVDCVKPVAASQAMIQPYNLDADVLDGEVTAYTTGSGGSSSGGTGTSGGSGSSGGSTSGGSTSSGGSHEYCSHEPWLCGGLGSSSSGGASGGSSKPDFYLITNEYDEIELQLSAYDADETSERDENLQLAASNLPVKEVVRVKNGTSYIFTVKLDVSSYSALNGSFKVVDCHGRESASVDVCVRPVKITGFEIQEKAPGAEDYTSLEDYHVVWQENSRRYYFHTLGAVDMDDPVDYAAFMNLFTYQVKGQAWTWDSTENDYVRSNAWNSFNGGLGVYNLQIDLYANNQKFHTLDDNGRYCFNAVSSVAWDSTINSDAETSSWIEYISDGSNGYKVFVEQPLDTESGTIGSLQNVAQASVSLAVPMPSGLTGTVYVTWFDPDNPIGSTRTSSHRRFGLRDNHGSISSLSSTVLTFTATSSQKQYFTATIGDSYAGDNYLLAAHPNSDVLSKAEINEDNCVLVKQPSFSSGGSASGGGTSDSTETVILDKSSMLTVWRSLWIERDQMTYTSVTGRVETADLVPMDGIVSSELARGCIMVREYSHNVTPTVPGVYTYSSVDESQTYTESRNLATPTNTLWTLLSTGGFYSNNDLGFFVNNNIVVFSSSVIGCVQGWNTTYGESYSTSEAVRRTTLHEIGHAFGLEDITVNTEAEITDEHVGIMVTGEGWNWNFRMYPTNMSFTIDNLQQIQSRNCPVVEFFSRD